VRWRRPRSANGASSFHLVWVAPPGAWTRAEATLEVIEPPSVAELYFWALQVSFADRGRRGGDAHLGLQWYPPHPGSTAVNWGGYGSDGRELEGSDSSLPSATANPNTRDFSWAPGVRYRLLVEQAGDARADGRRPWRGSVVDERTGSTSLVRDLWATGSVIESPMVWSEVFAPCDAPPAAVRWSGLRLGDDSGRLAIIDTVRVNYQRRADGGCSNTDSTADDRGFVQRTGTTRASNQDDVLSRP
jgi:hypothetical protein